MNKKIFFSRKISLACISYSHLVADYVYHIYYYISHAHACLVVVVAVVVGVGWGEGVKAKTDLFD